MNANRREFLELAAFGLLAGCAPAPLHVVAATRAAPTRNGTSNMKTKPLMTLRFTTAPTQNIGAVPHGERITFPITGGSFEGDRLRGNVIMGDDWVLKRADGVMELDIRVTLETDDGALIHTTITGLRNDHAEDGVYFRTLPRFETASPKYAFLNKLLGVGEGQITADGPVHVLEELL
jgi:Protein of unknown function (DUF3237)